MKRSRIKDVLKHPETVGFGNDVCVKGWVRTKRGNSNVAFIALNDGKTLGVQGQHFHGILNAGVFL